MDQGFLRWLAMCVVVLSLARPALADDDVSQVKDLPPAIYRQKLVHLLTPLETVLKKESDYSRLPGDQGLTLLDEKISYIGDDGRHLTVFHTIYKAINDAGAKSMAKNTYSYRKKLQKLYLVLAQTVQPDGTKVQVKNDEMFLKTPQSQEGDDLYDDDLDIEVVYPNVKPGSITEDIYIRDDADVRIPGEFSDVYDWSGGWPQYWQRFVLDLPKSMADRLKITNLGQGDPDPVSTDAGSTRKQMTWEKFNAAADLEDDTEAPTDQIGPMVWVSTLKSWDAFATWYAGLVKGTDALSPELKSKIDGWTKEAKDPVSIVQVLYQHVSQDVRYTGFELGKSDYQPHDCMSVWQRQYGDCKDKANLLRAMLLYKGVPAWLTLLQTEHAGVVNQANPDYRQFDHCIVNTQIGDQSLFCDPTITFGVPGLLAGSETDRDVLVLKDGHADWQHTPLFKDAKVQVSFDLKLQPNGQLAGWVEMNASGYYAASYRKKYRDFSKEDALSDFQSDVQDYYPNSTLVDLDLAKEPNLSLATEDSFKVRGYMTLPGVINQGDTTAELKFPSPNQLLPDFTDYKKRQHTGYLWADFNKVTAKVQLPPGWTATLPAPFSSDTDDANLQANWTSNPADGTVTADFQVTLKKSLFPSDNWESLGDTVTNLNSWVSKSLNITKSSDKPQVPNSDQELADKMPVMPTAEGQLNLIDQDFPSDGNVAARRDALARIPILFPNDPKSIVRAALEIGYLDLDDEKYATVIERLQGLLIANQADLDADTKAWANYQIAEAYRGETKKSKAQEMFQAIISDTHLDSRVRGWAIYRMAGMLEETSPRAALDCADKGLGLDPDTEVEIYSLYANIAATNHQLDRFKYRLKKLIASKPDDLERILISVVQETDQLVTDGHQPEALALADLVASVWKPQQPDDAVLKAVHDFQGKANALASYAKLQGELDQFLIGYPDLVAFRDKQSALTSADDAQKAYRQHADADESEPGFGATLAEVHFPADDSFPDYFWDCFCGCEWINRAAPSDHNKLLYDKLVELSDELPHSNSNYFEVQILRARVLERQQKRPDAAKIFDGLIAQKNPPDGYYGVLACLSGQNWEEEGDYVKALGEYKAAEPTVNDDAKSQEAVLRAIFINFDNGAQLECSRLMKLLVDAHHANKIKQSEQIAALVVDAEGTDLPAYWQLAQQWWPQWQKIEQVAGLDPVDPKKKVIPIIPNLVEVGKTLGKDQKEGDLKGAFASMRVLAYAGRFNPNYALELIAGLNVAQEMLPSQAGEIRLLAISILEKMVPATLKDKRARILYLEINYADSTRYQNLDDLMMTDWKPELEDSSVVSDAIHRLWALAAIQLRQHLDKVCALMEADLKGGQIQDRAITVGMLSDVYAALGRNKDAIALLNTEMAQPLIANDSAALKDLQARLDTLQNHSAASIKLANGMEEWLRDHKPVWWDFAEPKDANDPRLAKLDTLQADPHDEFSHEELIKAGLMAPQVSMLSPEMQQKVVLGAFQSLVETKTSQADLHALALSVLGNVSFDSKFKTTFFSETINSAFYKVHYASFLSLQKMPAFQLLDSDTQVRYNRMGLYCSIDHTSVPAIMEVANNIAAKPAQDWVDIVLLEHAIEDLTTLGDLTSARKVYDLLGNATLDSTVTESKPQIQLEDLKELDSQQLLCPMFEAMRQVILTEIQPDSITKPDFFDDRLSYNDFSDLSVEDGLKYQLYLIKIHQAPPYFFFWRDFMHNQEALPNGSALNFKLIKAALDKATDDDSADKLLTVGQYVFDCDQPDQRKTFLNLVQPYRDPIKYPHTDETLRLLDGQWALRTGQPVNLDTDLEGYTYRSEYERALFLKLKALLQSKDLNRLKALLDEMPADLLLKPYLLSKTVPALKMAKMDDQAAICKEVLKKELKRAALHVWVNRNELDELSRMIEAYGSSQDIPPGFDDFINTHIARGDSVHEYQMLTAFVQSDWPKVEVAATWMTQNYPTRYNYFWFLGKSQAEQGKKDDAIKALTVFCQYCHDAVEYPEAKDLLTKLNGTM